MLLWLLLRLLSRLGGWCDGLLWLLGLRRSWAASTWASSSTTTKAKLHTATSRRAELSILQVTRKQHCILSGQ